ncbi:MAG: cation:proton antiporter [Parachlamydiaceae bacterium]|nr:cation:proton antiporter [Parachlamydiaceae bacterium]
MEIPLLKDVAVIFGLAVIVLWICNRLRIPAIVGFLFTGVLSGPHGLQLVQAVSDVDMLAEIGIMLLLFTIGLEFSISQLMSVKRYFLIGGILQVGLTTLCGLGIGQIVGRPFGECIFLGFLLAMSSTAIVLKSLDARDETDSPHGRLILGILIFQDIAAVPMMLLTPVLGTAEGSPVFDFTLVLHLLMGIVVISVVFVAATKIVPALLYQLAKARSRELFSLSVLTICFAVAWLASSIGLSIAIGAFLAGLIISESDYRHEAIGNILPLQDIFSSLFFVSIGMLLDVRFVLAQPFLILGITIGVILLKAAIVGFTSLTLGLSLRVTILAAIGLAQIGEFSFVLASAGIHFGLGNEYLYQLFLAVALFTMALTPSLIGFSHGVVNWIMRLPIPEHWKSGLQAAPSHHAHALKDHIVIVGFGIAGRSLANAARATNVPYVILEMNPDTVRTEKAKGEPIHFGDATHESVQRHLHLQDARAIAVMINDQNAARRAIMLARRVNPNAYIIVRSRYVKDVQALRHLGANDVIPDEFGTSLEMLTRVLQRYDVPSEQVASVIDGLRSQGHSERQLQPAN